MLLGNHNKVNMVNINLTHYFRKSSFSISFFLTQNWNKLSVYCLLIAYFIIKIHYKNNVIHNYMILKHCLIKTFLNTNIYKKKSFVYLPITFHNPIKACFPNEKYYVTIQTRPT